MWGTAVSETAQPGGGLTIGLVDPDPYLTLTARREFPEATVRTAGGRDDLTAVQDADIVLVELHSPRIDEVIGSLRDEVPIVGVGRADHGEVDAERFDAVVVRPYQPQDLRRAIAELLDIEGPVTSQAPGLGARLQGWIAPARVAAVAVVAVLETAQPVVVADVRTAALALAFLYATARLRFLRRTRLGALVDVAVAVVLLAVTGGFASNYVIFAIVVAAGAGARLSTSEAFLAGVLLALAVVPSLIISVVTGTGPERTAPMLLALVVYPFAALAASQAVRILGEHPSDSSVTVLREANRALNSLYDIARDLPRSLTLESVANAILEEVGGRTDAVACLLLVEEAGVVYEVASRGLGQHTPLLAERESVGRALGDSSRIQQLVDDVPASVREASPSDLRWAVAPCTTGGGSAWMLVGTDEPMSSATRRGLRSLAREAGLAVDNARLFSRVRNLAVDDERVRIAQSLHDGVAQALAHVRLELELLSRYGPDAVGRLQEEVARLTAVTQRALADVRSTITDLRAVSLAGGLAVAIHDHCRDMRVLAGPTIDVRVRSSTRLDPEVEVELFQIFRTAVRVAMRHAGTERVEVLLEESEEEVHLVIEDDGQELPPRYDRRAARESAGLRSMRERAGRVDARLEISDREGGGTRIEVVCPFRPAVEPAEVTT